MTMEPVSIEKLPHEFIDKDGHSVERPGVKINYHVERGMTATGLFPGDRAYIDGRLYYEHGSIHGLDTILNGEPGTIHTINVPACDPETIVRALAAADAGEHCDYGESCAICGAGRPDGDKPLVTDHDRDCPWRLAVEWVADH